MSLTCSRVMRLIHEVEHALGARLQPNIDESPLFFDYYQFLIYGVDPRRCGHRIPSPLALISEAISFVRLWLIMNRSSMNSMPLSPYRSWRSCASSITFFADLPLNLCPPSLTICSNYRRRCTLCWPLSIPADSLLSHTTYFSNGTRCLAGEGMESRSLIKGLEGVYLTRPGLSWSL